MNHSDEPLADHNRSEPHPLDAEILPVSPEASTSSLARAKQALIRIAWLLALAGLVLTLAGNLLRGGRDLPLSPTANVCRSCGLLVMLGGALVALLAYRLPWLAAAVREFRVREPSGEPRTAPSPPSPGRYAWGFALLAMVLVVVISLLLLLILDAIQLVGIYAGVLTLLLFTAALIGMVLGTPALRGASLGAITPLLFGVWLLWTFTLSYSSSPLGPRRGYRPGSVWEYVEMQVDWLGDLLSLVGFSTGVLAVYWVLAFALGSVGFGVYLVLRRFEWTR